MASLWTLAMDLHTLAYRATGGRFGHTFPGAPPMLLLDHVGAKSGKRRTAPLGYIRDGDAYVVIASKGGDPRNPSWLHNLIAHPDTTIQAGSRKLDVRARVATPAERERLWPRAVEAYSGYSGYQARTMREIPLVVLEPRGS
jgi:deazaflavin-dependent oxidoreductase (nitroreductase family)